MSIASLLNEPPPRTWLSRKRVPKRVVWAAIRDGQIEATTLNGDTFVPPERKKKQKKSVKTHASFPPSDFPKRIVPGIGKPTPAALRLRELLYAEQKGVCYYCKKAVGFSLWTIEHKTPVSRGGSWKKENKVGACKTCNGHKANLTEEEYRMVGADHKKRKALIAQVSADHLSSLPVMVNKAYRPDNTLQAL